MDKLSLKINVRLRIKPKLKLQPAGLVDLDNRIRHSRRQVSAKRRNNQLQPVLVDLEPRTTNPSPEVFLVDSVKLKVKLRPQLLGLVRPLSPNNHQQQVGSGPADLADLAWGINNSSNNSQLLPADVSDLIFFRSNR